MERLRRSAVATRRRPSSSTGTALAIWRGEPLADLAFEPFAVPVVERLRGLRLAVLEQCLDAELELGRGAVLVAELEQVVAEHPLNERLRGQLMLALYRAGRQAEALEVFREGRAALVDAFGLEPVPALKELETRILLQDPALDGLARSRKAPEPQDPRHRAACRAGRRCAGWARRGRATSCDARPARAAGHAGRRERVVARRRRRRDTGSA